MRLDRCCTQYRDMPCDHNDEAEMMKPSGTSVADAIAASDARKAIAWLRPSYRSRIRKANPAIVSVTAACNS
jgi:hypothetical protein